MPPEPAIEPTAAPTIAAPTATAPPTAPPPTVAADPIVPAAVPAPKLITDPAPEVDVPQNFPDNWRELMTGGDEKDMIQALRHDSPKSVWKSMREGQKTMSTYKAPLEMPGAESSEDDVAAYRKEAGIPEDFKDYNLDFGDGTVIGDDVKSQLEGYLEHAHSNHTSPAAVKETVGWFLQDVARQQEEMASMNDEARVKGITDLKVEWGGEFEGNMNAMNSLFVNAPEGAQKTLMTMKDSNGLSFGNNPDNIKMLVGWAKELNPAATLLPPGGDQIASVDARIKEIMSWQHAKTPDGLPDKATQNKYWHDGAVQDELTRLENYKDKQAG